MSLAGVVSVSKARPFAAIGLIVLGLMGATVLFHPSRVFAQGELTRKVKTRVQPAYPELARRMNITGTVKVLVVVSPNGSVKDSRVVGGNPILVNAAVDALKKWKFEPAHEDSSGTVEFRFQSKQ
jgi:TonB family protein